MDNSYRYCEHGFDLKCQQTQ